MNEHLTGGEKQWGSSPVKLVARGERHAERKVVQIGYVDFVGRPFAPDQVRAKPVTEKEVHRKYVRRVWSKAEDRRVARMVPAVEHGLAETRV